jgi:hypothetical protein
MFNRIVGSLRQANQGNQNSLELNTMYNIENKNNNNKCNKPMNRPFHPINNGDSLNPPKDFDVNIKNNNLKQNYNNYLNTNNANVLTKKKFNHNRVNNDLRFGSTYNNNNVGTKNEVFYKEEHESVLTKDNDLSFKSNHYGLKKYDNDFNNNNSYNVSKDKVGECNNTITTSTTRRICKNENIDKLKMNSLNNNNNNVAVEINQNLDIDYYLNAALNMNSENNTQSESKNESNNDCEVNPSNPFDLNIERVSLNLDGVEQVNNNDDYSEIIEDNLYLDKSKVRVKGSSKSLLSQDLKELVDGIKKNKDKIRKPRDSIHSSCEVTKSSESEARTESLNTTHEKDKREVNNISLTIGPEQKPNEEKSKVKENQDSSNYDLPFSRIPNNLLNAKNYGDYFFNQNGGRDSNPNKNSNQNKVKYHLHNFIISGYLR